jgi:hypothetical protein
MNFRELVKRQSRCDSVCSLKLLGARCCGALLIFLGMAWPTWAEPQQAELVVQMGQTSVKSVCFRLTGFLLK